MAVQFNTDRIQGYPVSKEISEKVYCGLGETNWWKQLYDGKYHQLGPKVFDEGLHGKKTEPGYYDSARRAFEFAKHHLNEKINVEFYRNLHKEACAHFKGNADNTEMNAHDAGSFRSNDSSGVRCKIGLRWRMEVFDRNRLTNDGRRKDVIKDYAILMNSYGDKILEGIADMTLHDKEIWLRKFTITVEEAKEIGILIQSKFKSMQETLDQWKQDPILKKAVPRIDFDSEQLNISYREPRWHNFSFDEVIPYLFETFNRSLAEIDEELVNTSLNEQSRKESLIHKKLVLIADLFQKLELMHPFPDGQGRTDLLLLSKLLAENGFTPAILDEPYMSSFSSLEDWVDYLIEGMQKWQKEALIQ
jgi:hypothetical protein